MPVPLPPAYPAVTDPARPAWHFGPPAQWMNDPNGVCWHEGWWHVFYQHNPHGDAWADMHWGHARSRDLVRWEHLPVALRPQPAAGEHHCYSGCLAFTAAGEPRILYTSVPPAGPRAATQVLATPDDPGWLRWTQHVATPVLDLATHDGPAFGGDWRDPFVFRADHRTFLILGATLGEEAVIPLYENPAGDLRHWTYRGIIHRAPRRETPFFECPNLIRFGEKWLLLTSPGREAEWCSGTLDLRQYAFHAGPHGRVDESTDYYATYPATDSSGRVVLFGWVRHFPAGRGWNGCLGVPRRIWLDAAGGLGREPVAEISALRSGDTRREAGPLTATPLTLALPAGAMGEIELTIARAATATVGCELAGLTLEISDAGVRFGGRPPVPLADPGASLHLHWLVDRSLVEVFVNRHLACTTVVPYPFEPRVRLSTTGSARLVAACIRTFHPFPAGPAPVP